MGTVYLIHFDQAIGNPENPRAQAQHYLGCSERSLEERLQEHQMGRTNSAKIMLAVRALGIGWKLARTWEGDYATERRLKRRHKARQLCPICRQLADECGHRKPGRGDHAPTEEKEMQG